MPKTCESCSHYFNPSSGENAVCTSVDVNYRVARSLDRPVELRKAREICDPDNTAHFIYHDPRVAIKEAENA